MINEIWKPVLENASPLMVLSGLIKNKLKEK